MTPVEVVAEKLADSPYDLPAETFRELAKTYNVAIIRCYSDDLVHLFAPDAHEEWGQGKYRLIPKYLISMNDDYDCDSNDNSEFLYQLMEAATEYAGAPIIEADWMDYKEDDGFSVKMVEGSVQTASFAVLDGDDLYGYGLIVSYEDLKRLEKLSKFYETFTEADMKVVGISIAKGLGY